MIQENCFNRNLDILNKKMLESMINQAYIIHQGHPEDEILAENFNALQMAYKEMHGNWYKPRKILDYDQYLDNTCVIKGYN